MFVDVYKRQVCMVCFFFFQAEDGIRDLVRSRGLGDVYKRQVLGTLNVVGGFVVTDRMLEMFKKKEKK